MENLFIQKVIKNLKTESKPRIQDPWSLHIRSETLA